MALNPRKRTVARWSIAWAAGFGIWSTASSLALWRLVVTAGPGATMVPRWFPIHSVHDAAAIGLLTGLGIWAWLAVESAIRLDPDRVATRTLLWSIRAVLRPQCIVAWALVLLATYLILSLDAGEMTTNLVGGLALSGVLVGFIRLPFGVCREKVARSSNGAGWWGFRWPGTASVALAAGLLLVHFTLPGTLAAMGVQIVTWFVATHSLQVEVGSWTEVAGWILVLPLLPAAAGSLVFGDGIWGGVRRTLKGYRYPRLGPLIAIQLRLLLAQLLVLPLIYANLLIEYQIIPIATDERVAAGAAFTYWERLGIGAYETLGSWIYTGLLGPVWLGIWFALARFAWIIERERTQP